MKKLSIVGGGIIGAMEAYRAFKEAQEKAEPIRITIYEAHKSLDQTTAMLIAPSLTPDEILSVVPRGKTLVEKLRHLFSEPGGIRVDDVAGVMNSVSAREFIRSVEIDGEDAASYEERTRALLELGKLSMDLWQDMYDKADDKLKSIMRASNFKPCRETAEKTLGKGYRIDLISGIENAAVKAEGMRKDYEGLGYANCKILSPSEVISADPSLEQFCLSHSELNAAGERAWKNDAVALWRPGGCIDIKTFLPAFYDYLKEAMGKHNGKDLFHLKLNRRVENVLYADEATINGVVFPEHGEKHNKHAYEDSQYVFCPGSAVGTLSKLGFVEPAYTGFAGAVLKLNVPVPPDLLPAHLKKMEALDNCMEVHQEGVVLAWQARWIDGAIRIAVAGTKAFYGEVEPSKNQAFALEKNLLQLNIVNEVMPEALSLALGRDSKGQKLSMNDLRFLEEKGMLQRGVGVRAVAYDGFPVIGQLYRRGAESVAIKNARTTTSLGSGGVSFATGAVHASASKEQIPLLEAIRKLGDARRTAKAVALLPNPSP
jgi:hypothetical protein